MHVHVSVVALRNQKRALHPMKLKLRVIVSYLASILGIEGPMHEQYALLTVSF